MALDPLFRKIAGNVKADPTNERFRRLKLSNAKFLERVWNNEQLQMLMLAAGWVVEESGEAVVLPETADTNILWDLVNEMDPQPAAQAPVAPSPVAAAAASRAAAAASTAPAPASSAACAPGGGSSASKRAKVASGEEAVLAERQKVLDKIKREKAEKRRIKAQMQADRVNQQHREIRASHAQLPEGGGTRLNRFSDIGVDLNKGGG